MYQCYTDLDPATGEGSGFDLYPTLRRRGAALNYRRFLMPKSGLSQQAPSGLGCVKTPATVFCLSISAT
jgi:hypothetical protein